MARSTDRTNGDVPVNWLGELGIKFAVIQTSSFKPLLRQFRENYALHCDQTAARRLKRRPLISEHRPYSKIRHWQRLARFHSVLLVALYLAIALKYALVQLVAPGFPLEPYQFLDCFLVGRFKLIGRTSRLSGPLAAFFLLYFAAYRIWLVCLVPRFKFSAYEFLLTDFDEVPPDGAHLSARSNRWPARSAPRFNSIVYLRDHCAAAKSNCGPCLVRLNRTRDSWLSMVWWSRWMVFVSVAYLGLWLVVLSYLLAGSICTNLGFEMSYSTCVHWLRDQQRNNSNPGPAPYSYIYIAPHQLASEMSLDQMPIRVPLSLAANQFNLYQLVRLTADIVENCFIYTEFTLCFLGHLHILTINSVDILQNAQKIRSLLIGLIERPLVRQISWPDRFGWEPAQDRRDLAECQAILVDHFRLIMAHNSYASFFYVFLFAGWLLYTVVICVWMAQVQSRAVEFEFVMVELACSLLCISYFVSSNLVHSSSFHLYALITKLMAADSPNSVTKLRWLTILMYYFPRSLCCVSIFGYFRISWFFSLKVSVYQPDKQAE